MKNQTNLFSKFVFIIGIFNFPIGIGLIAQALLARNPETLIIQTVLGAFILFGGAALIWASKDIQTRVPIVLWNGMVRASGFAICLYAYSLGAVPTELIPIAASDLVLAFFFIIGSVRATGIPFSKLVLAKN